MLEPQQSLDVQVIVDRARSLWGNASEWATTDRVELFAKAAMRFKVNRDLDGTGVTFDRVLESGLAVRALRAGREHAGFAAASGLSDDVGRWAVETACTYRAQVPASAPDPSDSIAEERWDVDAATSLPSEESLTEGLSSRPQLQWVEAGTTVEVLIGAEGWLAVRRRHRLWALGGEPGARLVAQRGFAGWHQLLDSSGANDSFDSLPASRDLGVLVLTPDAASSVVAALIDAFHGTGPGQRASAGDGWDIADEPIRPDGLSGGSFDDAGFPAISRVLSANGVWVGALAGPGTFRRASFRDPPAESATNLVMVSGNTEAFPASAAVARRCRVLRPSPDLWVLELDLLDGGNGGSPQRRWVRVQPRALLAACTARLGRSRLTPEGPIVPALLFEGLQCR